MFWSSNTEFIWSSPFLEFHLRQYQAAFRDTYIAIIPCIPEFSVQTSAQVKQSCLVTPAPHARLTFFNSHNIPQ